MKFVLKTLIFFLLYTIVFRPQYFFLPASVNVTFGIIGILSYVLFNKEWILNNEGWEGIKPIFDSVLPFLVIAVLSGIFNLGGDGYFIKYAVSVFLSFFSLFTPVYLIYKVYGNVRFETILNYLILCNIVYLTLAVAMFLLPGLRDVLLSLLNSEERTLEALQITEGLRLQAFGTSFFNAGVMEGFFLVLLALCVKFEMFEKNGRIFLLLCILIFGLISFFLARTAVIGLLMALFILMTYYLGQSKRNIGEPITVIVVCVLAVVGIFACNPHVLDNFSSMFLWAFEAFYNYSYTGSFETYSTSTTLGMFEIIPDNIKTWMIGDSLWIDSRGAYYMETDVGWLRMTFYFGVLGVLSMLFYFFHSLRTIYVNHLYNYWGDKGYFAFRMMLIYVMIMNLKGFADIFYLSILFYYCECNSPSNETE